MPPPLTPYSNITFAQAKQTLLRDRLNSTGTDFWTDAEAGFYITEAIRTWNALTGQYVVDFTTTYDASNAIWQSTANGFNSLTGNNPTSPRYQTLSTTDLFTLIQFHLLEPPTGQIWSGTPQFTLADFNNSFQRRRDVVLQLTGCNIGPFSDTFGLPIGQRRVYLPDTTAQSILDIRRVRYVPVTSIPAAPVNLVSLKLPTSAINTNTWTNPNAILISDGTFATDALTNLSEATYRSSTIDVIGFNFALPADAVIDNIRVGLKGLASAEPTNWEFQFLQAGAPVGFASQTATALANTESFTDITPTSIALNILGVDVNDPLFGLRIDFLSPTAGVTGSADGVSLEITYHEPGSGTEVVFGASSTLYREDGLAFEYFENDFTVNNGDTPFAWDVLAGPPLALTFDATAEVPNILDMLTMISGGTITPPAAAPLLIPDDWYWVIKFGMMSDLLRQSTEATDLERADYCEKRFQEGVQLMMELPWLLQARINNLPVDTPSVTEMDTFAYEWQSDPDSQLAIVRGGVDLFALSPNPQIDASGGYGDGGYGDGGYGGTGSQQIAITLSLVANAAVPLADGDFLQVSRDVLDGILDYAQHLAYFKQGGFEFAESTRTLYKSFVQTAVATNSRLKESGIFASTLRPPNSRQDAADPRYAVSTQ